MVSKQYYSKIGIVFLLTLLTAFGSYAQKGTPQIVVQPFLQDATPNSIIIKWETSFGEESLVEWGLTPKLKNNTKGKSYSINFNESRVHEVEIKELKRFTDYYYRVKTGKTTSDVFQFKTPPFASDEESFNLVAMSDMQYDWQYPNKFSEMVNEGVLQYLEKEYSGSLSKNLALVMLPGDLVENGAVYNQWKDHFFGPSKELFSKVPVYPVPGNHERNSRFYFKYFSLPENGTPAYAEHWYYKDYGNTRIIGLDSNDGYHDISAQLDWLKVLLKKTAEDASIDFVFAQLHHPHKSELWIPGEAKFSGKVVKLLEAFSTQTGKPSIHFFGHTHGYSRGQSKDHKHLWINVATAGGAIDNWGEFEGRDYDEFTVTQDEYGFVMVEVDGSKTDPKFTVKRISRGNNKQFRSNELRDSITIWKNERKPNPPTGISPKDAPVKYLNIVLKAGNFGSKYTGTFHAASHWQISTTENFEKPVVDRWKQHENWYYEANRQKEDDLTDEVIERLKPEHKYFWRVRYRDQNLNWSDWSTVTVFKTIK